MLQIISLSDIFISPLEDLYHPATIFHPDHGLILVLDILSRNFLEPICTASSPLDLLRNNSFNTSSIRYWYG